jgi:DNA-binding NarL/FixJ family response regulator
MNSPAHICVLVVEDLKSVRKILVEKVRQLPEIQEVFEPEDGLQAVAKSEELRPDLILLDIGLPKLNGLEAAKLIRKHSPNSKMIFVSQESAPDVVRLAFELGAYGYVVKLDVGRDLVTSIKTVLRGRKFVGPRFANHHFFENSDESHEIRRHEMLVCSEDIAFLDGFTQFIGPRLMRGNAVVVVATEQHRNGLLLRLQLFGVDIGSVQKERRYIALDAAETLNAVLVNGVPDEERFSKKAGELILGVAEAAKIETDRIAACGECAPLLRGQASIQLERMWNNAIRQYNVEVFCGYPLQCLKGGLDSELSRRICAEHSALSSV